MADDGEDVIDPNPAALFGADAYSVVEKGKNFDEKFRELPYHHPILDGEFAPEDFPGKSDIEGHGKQHLDRPFDRPVGIVLKISDPKKLGMFRKVMGGFNKFFYLDEDVLLPDDLVIDTDLGKMSRDDPLETLMEVDRSSIANAPPVFKKEVEKVTKLGAIIDAQNEVRKKQGLPGRHFPIRMRLVNYDKAVNSRGSKDVELLKLMRVPAPVAHDRRWQDRVSDIPTQITFKSSRRDESGVPEMILGRSNTFGASNTLFSVQHAKLRYQQEI